MQGSYTRCRSEARSLNDLWYAPHCHADFLLTLAGHQDVVHGGHEGERQCPAVRAR